jgi:hypothetical protein
MALAQRCGLDSLLVDRLSVGVNAAVKVLAVVAGMVGADSITDLDLLRHGGMTRQSDGVRSGPRPRWALSCGRSRSATSVSSTTSWCWSISTTPRARPTGMPSRAPAVATPASPPRPRPRLVYGQPGRVGVHPDGSWLNWIEAEFAALRYFALNGTDHRSHAEQNAAIAGYVRWHNTRAKPKVHFAVNSPIRTWTDYPVKAA